MEFNELLELIKKECGIEKETITENDRLAEDLYMNSFSYMLLIVSIERKCNINVPIDKLKNIKTVEELYRFINKICS